MRLRFCACAWCQQHRRFHRGEAFGPQLLLEEEALGFRDQFDIALAVGPGIGPGERGAEIVAVGPIGRLPECIGRRLPVLDAGGKQVSHECRVTIARRAFLASRRELLKREAARAVEQAIASAIGGVAHDQRAPDQLGDVGFRVARHRDQRQRARTSR